MRTEIDAYIDEQEEKLPPIYMEIEKVASKYHLLLPMGVEIDLNTFKECEQVIKGFQKRAQFRNQGFILLDRNTKIEYKDFRIFTKYIEACHEQQKFQASVRKHRLGNRKYFPRKVKKIDPKLTKPYERTW